MIQILIVDDEEPIRALLRHIFEILRPAYQVQTTADGLTGLQQLQRRPFELVIADYQMPEMTGLELAEQIRQQWPGTPVLIMSGRPPSDLVIRLQQLGAAGYLKKPFTPHQLLNAVDQTLGQVKATETRAL